MQPYRAKHTMNATIAMTNAQMAPWVAQINVPTITAAISNHASKATKKLMSGVLPASPGGSSPDVGF